MEHADTAQLAAVGGAVGAVLVLLARGRLTLLAGLVLLAAAEAGLALSLGPGSLDRLTSAGGRTSVAPRRREFTHSSCAAGARPDAR